MVRYRACVFSWPCRLSDYPELGTAALRVRLDGHTTFSYGRPRALRNYVMRVYYVVHRIVYSCDEVCFVFGGAVAKKISTVNERKKFQP